MYLNKNDFYNSWLAQSWTLTWDVFKYSKGIEYPLVFNRWTLTWDVFKLGFYSSR